MSGYSGITRARVVGLMAEATMVVFAVLVALALEEWRQEQRLLQLAERAQASVVAEVEANLEELDGARPSLLRAQEALGEVLATEDLTLIGDELNLELPDLSSTAWEVAQGSEAAPYFEYEWVIRMARAHEILDVYSNATEEIIAGMATIIGHGATLEHIADVYGWLVIVNDVHGQTDERLRQVLAESVED